MVSDLFRRRIFSSLVLQGTGCVTILFFCLLESCTTVHTTKSAVGIRQAVDHGPWIVHEPYVVQQDTSIYREVVLMPGGRILSAHSGIHFYKRVEITGATNVFDTSGQYIFAAGTLSSINPRWFGAKGDDDQDDTPYFEKALEIAGTYPGTITVDIPAGIYNINRTLRITCPSDNIHSINLKGDGMSNSGVGGSSLRWTGTAGQSMLYFSQVNTFFVRDLDFTSSPQTSAQSNLEFRPYIHNVDIFDCHFMGCGGPGSCNINWNSGNGDQVSEIRISGCVFSGQMLSDEKRSESAIRGGLANTKNLYIDHCAFGNYRTSAIDVPVTDVLHVENCTFSNNDIDIDCRLCGTYAVSNYSEHSNGFFSGGASSNLAFTTLINNTFIGQPKDGYAIRDGGGSLVLIHNDFGGGDQENEYYRIRWEKNQFNSIFSLGNFYKNADKEHYPFYNRTGQPNANNVTSLQDIGGKAGTGKKIIKD